jgi:hypothetical protein
VSDAFSVSPQAYKEKAHANYDAWKLGLDALDPGAQTSEESELLAWHERNILKTEVASVQLPGGQAKKMEKIKSEMGEQVCFHITILREIDANEFFRQALIFSTSASSPYHLLSMLVLAMSQQLKPMVLSTQAS